MPDERDAIILTSSALNNKMIDVAHKHRGHHGSHHVATILLASGGFFLFGYVLLEKKLLPRAWWRPAGRWAAIGSRRGSKGPLGMV